MEFFKGAKMAIKARAKEKIDFMRERKKAYKEEYKKASIKETKNMAKKKAKMKYGTMKHKKKKGSNVYGEKSVHDQLFS